MVIVMKRATARILTKEQISFIKEKDFDVGGKDEYFVEPEVSGRKTK